jgi:hypothetical protein
MTPQQLRNKIDELRFWVDNNPNHKDLLQQRNLLLHYEFELNKRKNLTV